MRFVVLAPLGFPRNDYDSPELSGASFLARCCFPFFGVVGSAETPQHQPPKLDQGLIGPLLALFLGVPSPFFPGILLFRKPSKTQGETAGFGKERWLKRMDRESTPSLPFFGWEGFPTKIDET